MAKKTVTNALLFPLWPAASHVVAGVTTRLHLTQETKDSCDHDTAGNSSSFNSANSFNKYGPFNLADHVGDDPSNVKSNREALDKFLTDNIYAKTGTLESLQWQWLNQTHSNRAIQFRGSLDEDWAASAESADAIWTNQANSVCAVLTADCLPILLCSQDGETVGAIHAGWRGILNGVIANTVASLVDSGIRASTLYAWLGPAIGPHQFEVGADVLTLFRQSTLASDPYQRALQQAFVPKPTDKGHSREKYLADLYQLGTIALRQCGVHSIYGGGFCTYNDANRFYSYRRDGVTGRQLSFIFRKEN